MQELRQLLGKDLPASPCRESSGWEPAKMFRAGRQRRRGYRLLFVAGAPRLHAYESMRARGGKIFPSFRQALRRFW
jgi:hypothetical protein